jgi:hypothetical protein
LFADYGLRRRGYAIVPGIVTPSEVARLREISEAWFETADMEEMPASVFLRTPELARIPLGDNVVTALKSIYGGSFVTYPNFAVRKDHYVGWHIDPAFAGPDKGYVWAPDFLHVQCVIYLQDNDREHGGGLDVMSGSHKPLFRLISGRHPAGYYGVQIANRIVFRWARHTLRIRAGDLVLWHGRAVHRSTPVSVDTKKTKYAIFFSTGQPDDFAINQFLAELVRQRYQLINGTPRFNPRHEELLKLHYPDAFPPEMVESATKHGVRVTTF